MLLVKDGIGNGEEVRYERRAVTKFPSGATREVNGSQLP